MASQKVEKNILLNPNKTNFISFLTQQHKTKSKPFFEIDQIQVSDWILEFIVRQEYDMGCTYYRSSEKYFIQIVCLKCVSKYCNIETLKTAYFSHIHPQ